jgi:hypothetical protein
VSNSLSQVASSVAADSITTWSVKDYTLSLFPAVVTTITPAPYNAANAKPTVEFVGDMVTGTAVQSGRSTATQNGGSVATTNAAAGSGSVIVSTGVVTSTGTDGKLVTTTVVSTGTSKAGAARATGGVRELGLLGAGVVFAGLNLGGI